LKPHALEKVRAWASEINARTSEAFIILQREGVLIESAFLDEIAGDHYLVYFIKVEDHKKSMQISNGSNASLDEYHRQFKKECWESVKELELLVNLDLTEPQ
jgi:hypothetical protein